ncbi:MAG: undecaprenyl-diphosphate phosphatase [Patescibacteria group bacterium]
MNIIHAIILGVVEGITEFLPVSSTGHLILSSKLLGLTQDDFMKTFEIAIQSGAILAVIALYWKKFFNSNLLKKTAVAFIPTAVIGFALYKIIKNVFLSSDLIVLVALFTGGLVLILIEMWLSKRSEEGKEEVTDMANLSYKQAAIIGTAQALAVIPGVSRSAASIIGGRVIGLSRSLATEFSFFLAVPTILFATLYDLKNGIGSISYDQGVILGIGLLISFITAIFVIKLFLSYIRKHDFTVFGVYRIVVSVFLYIVLFRM